jgi:hypothetical protein
MHESLQPLPADGRFRRASWARTYFTVSADAFEGEPASKGG